MSIEKKSLISTLKTTKRANVASSAPATVTSKRAISTKAVQKRAISNKAIQKRAISNKAVTQN
jgi:hypothetical protein